MTVNYETGEIVEPGTDLAPVDKSSAASVITYLDRARSWLATAVEVTGPAEIAMAKAQIATAAEATKQLGLSKEIREDAVEMVRRAEYTLRKATTKAQESGEVRTRSDNLTPGQGNPVRSAPSDTSKASPSDFFSGSAEYRDANAMGALSEDEFEDVLAEAKAEGNLSRANVASKARERSGKPEKKAAPRRALTDTARDLGQDLRKITDRLERLRSDDRLSRNRDEVAAHLRHHLVQAIAVCQDLDRQINSPEGA